MRERPLLEELAEPPLAPARGSLGPAHAWVSASPLRHRFRLQLENRGLRLQGSPGQMEPTCISLSSVCSLDHICQVPSLPGNTCM